MAKLLVFYKLKRVENGHSSTLQKTTENRFKQERESDPLL